MGFDCFHISANRLPKTLISLLQLFAIIHYCFSTLLFRLGLNPSFESEISPWDNEELLFSAEPPRSLQDEAELLKSRLPAVEYISVVRRNGGGVGAAAGATCVVCLQLLEARDEVRVLGNCCHAFHVGCIDRWIDLGRFSCPLCRAALLPSAGWKTGGGGMVGFLKFVVLGVLRCN